MRGCSSSMATGVVHELVVDGGVGEVAPASARIPSARYGRLFTPSDLKSAWIYGLPQTSLLSPTTIGCRSKHVLYIPAYI